MQKGNDFGGNARKEMIMWEMREKKRAHDENPSNSLRCGFWPGLEYKADVNLHPNYSYTIPFWNTILYNTIPF